MYAVVSIKGNQFKFAENQEYKIDLVSDAPEDKKIEFTDVLMISDDKKVTFGNPTIKGASVTATILNDLQGEKVGVFKFHSKKRYTRNKGHRQDYTLIKVLKINS